MRTIHMPPALAQGTDRWPAQRRALHFGSPAGHASPANRSFFHERLDHALAQAEPQRQALAVLYLDLEGLHPAHGTQGHDAGSELLGIVATRLTRVLRAQDVVSHLEGDAFACLSSFGGSTSREQLCQLACRVFDAVAAPFQIGTRRLSVHPSIGVARWPADGATGAALLSHAEAAMAHARRHETGYALIDPGAGAGAGPLPLSQPVVQA
jgi:diguanylate cyclase